MPVDPTTLPVPALSRERRERGPFGRGVLAGLGVPFAAFAFGGFGGKFTVALAILTVAVVALDRVTPERVGGVLVGVASGVAIGFALVMSVAMVALSGDW